MDILTDYRAALLSLVSIFFSVFFLIIAMKNKGHGWRYFYNNFSDYNWIEAVVGFFLSLAILMGCWYFARSLRINDFPEQIGGFITDKYTVDGDHQESYEECTGSGEDRRCTTYYYTVYHRDFVLENSTGDWWSGWQWIERVDKPNEFSEPNYIPQYYLESYVGKPVSLAHGYKNYIAPMNETVYKNTYEGLAVIYEDICPETSDVTVSYDTVLRAFPLGFEEESATGTYVYSWNLYRNDTLFSPSPLDISDPAAIPMYMDTMFGYLGSEVQGDPHVYVVNSTNIVYADMCMAKWKNGAKNSIYVFIFGTETTDSFRVSDVIVTVGVDGTKKNSDLEFENEGERSNYYMKYDIRNDLMTYFNGGGAFEREGVLRIIFDNIREKFMRQEMAANENLKHYVFPTSGQMIVVFIILLIANLAVHGWFANNDI